MCEIILLNNQQTQIDSLSKIIKDISISESYFSDILTAQTAIFSTIIGLAALLGWGGVYLYFNKRFKQQNNDLVNMKVNIQQEAAQLIVKYQNLELQVYISTYMGYRNSKMLFMAFLSGLRLLEKYYETSPMPQNTVKSITANLLDLSIRVEKDEMNEEFLLEANSIIDKINNIVNSEMPLVDHKANINRKYYNGIS